MNVARIKLARTPSGLEEVSITTHTDRHSGITNMYLSHKYTIVRMMYVGGYLSYV